MPVKFFVMVFIYGVTGGSVGRDPNLGVFCFLCFFKCVRRKSNQNLSFFLLTQKIWKPITNVLGDALEVVRVRVRVRVRF